MKKVLLSLSLLFVSSVSFASFDTSFTKLELQKMTPEYFDDLAHERQVELGILFISREPGVSTFILNLNNDAYFAVQEFAQGVPPMFEYCSWEDRKSARGKVLKATLKAIAMGFAKEVPVQIAKQLVGCPV